jgi:hypothetical protein
VTPDAATIAVIDALDRAAIPFMIVGSLASNFHGIPRATRDANFVIQAGSARISSLAAALPDGLRLEPQAAFETVTGTTRYLVSLQQSPFVCELFLQSDDPHDAARFERRERVRVLNRDVCMATADDMIITKLRWATEAHRTKDRDDVRNIIAVRGAELDWRYIERWCAAHDTSALLDEIRRSIPTSDHRHV